VVEGAPPPARPPSSSCGPRTDDGDTKPEAYALEVSPTGVTITAAKRAGLFYGAVSVWQLAVQDAAKGPAPSRRQHRRRPALRLARPDAGQRPPLPELEAIKRIIDAMAAHKLNTCTGTWSTTRAGGWRSRSIRS
jgi:hexosaminidase